MRVMETISLASLHSDALCVGCFRLLFIAMCNLSGYRSGAVLGTTLSEMAGAQVRPSRSCGCSLRHNGGRTSTIIFAIVLSC